MREGAEARIIMDNMAMRGDTERPLIGLTAWTRLVRSGAKERLNETAPRGYVEGVSAAGGLPVVLPNGDPSQAPSLIARLEGLLLTGGDDVHPSHFGEAPHPKIELVDERRDRFEIALVHAARARGLPVFGICRGVQLMNVALGGDLFQDIPAQVDAAVAHTQRTLYEGPWHEIDLRPGTRLSSILGAPRVAVNSYHHQACRRVGPPLVVAATAPDGVIEGLEDPGDAFFLGVQWHPEVLEGGLDPTTRRLFAAFVDAAREFGRASSKERPAVRSPAQGTPS
jgi:putative glutamine amidotransferase